MLVARLKTNFSNKHQNELRDYLNIQIHQAKKATLQSYKLHSGNQSQSIAPQEQKPYGQRNTNYELTSKKQAFICCKQVSKTSALLFAPSLTAFISRSITALRYGFHNLYLRSISNFIIPK